MILLAETAFAASAKIIALGVLFQSIELIQLRRTLNDTGVWQWGVLTEEFKIFPVLFRAILSLTLCYPNVLVLLGLRAGVGFAVIVTPWDSVPVLLLLYLLLSTLLICLRFRGTFNGGSDYMTVVVLTGLTIARVAPASIWVSTICLWYIAIQSVTSYFVAGVVKIRHREWRTGEALACFLQAAKYRAPKLVSRLLAEREPSMIATWAMLLFECLFPLALFGAAMSPIVPLAFIAIAGLFHFSNVYIFGLNRFLFAWTATYPAIYWCSQLFQ